MNAKIIQAWLLAILGFLGHAGPALAADVNVLIIGSTRDSGEKFNSGSGWQQQKPSFTPNSRAFSPNRIATELRNILNGAGVGSVNVVTEERYKTATAANGWSVQSYNLASWFHFPYPTGVETSTRWPNLRGENGTQWDYVILIGDPYTMEYTPGMYAHGVAQVANEVSKGPGETLLLMPRPGSGSSSSIDHYKEVVYRAGRSGGFKVIPAGLAWQASNQNLGSSHPTNNGAYLAAASIYSRIWNQNAATSSSYNYSDSLANIAYNTVNNNKGRQQYSGDYSFQNPYLMVEDKRRDIHFSSRGTSTEWGFRQKLYPAIQSLNMTYNESYNGRYSSNTPEDDGMGWPSHAEMPIAFNLGRDGFYSEAHKSYVVNPNYWQLGYGFYYQPEGGLKSGTAEEQKDIYAALMQNHDHDLANRMLNEQPGGSNLPLRTLYAKIHQERPDVRPQRDGTHLHNAVDHAAAHYMFTMYSGRCALDPMPTVPTDTWVAQRIGYETAWLMGKCQTRAPGFKVKPATSSAVISPSSPQEITVQFILKPKADVTVTINSSNDSAGRVYPNTLIFTPDNHDLAQIVTVYGATGEAGTFPFDINFTTSSNDEVYDNLNDSWNFENQRTSGPSPSNIQVVGNGEVIANGDRTPELSEGTDFGYTSTFVEKTYTIRNFSSSSTLNLSSSPRVSLTDQSGSFSLTQDASQGSLAPGQETTFAITYEPISIGTHTATVSITSNDASIPTYTFDIKGSEASIQSHLITASSFAGGSITPNGSISIAHGGEQTFNIVANEGFIIADLIVDGVSVGATNSYTFNNVTGSHDIKARFQSLTTGWSPADITTHLWLDAADTASIISNGGTFLQWSDKSGNNRHAAQGVSSAIPGTRVAALNGLDVITFDGNSDYLDVDLEFLAGESHSAFIVTKANTYSNIYGAANGGSGSSSLHVGFKAASPNRYRMNFWGNDFHQIVGSSFKADETNILNYIWTPGVRKEVFSNGTLEGSTNSAGEIGAMAGGGRIGRVVGHSFYGGDIAEIVMITGGVDQDTREKMEGYLAHKWGLEGNLPGTHPYKDSAPGLSTPTFNVVATSGVGGSITPSGTTSVQEGSNLTYTITPNSGYIISDVTVDGISMGALSSYTFSNVSATHSINAKFIPIPPVTYEIVSTSGVGGSVAPSGTTTVQEGSSQSYTIEPISGYMISDLTVNGVSIGAVSGYTFNSVDADGAIHATFELITPTTYEIVATSGAGGSISPNGTQSVQEGSNQSYTMTPSSGYLVSDVMVDGISVGAVGSYTFSDVTTHHSISVTFTEQGTSGLWTPAEISTELWLDASERVSLFESSGDQVENNDLVYEWKDKSGKGRDLSQSNSIVRPIYKAGGWSNGEGQIEFDTYNGATRAHSLGRDISSDGFPSTGFTLFVAINPRSIDQEAWLTTMKTTDGKEHRFQINNTGIKVRSDSANGGTATTTYASGEQILQLTLDASHSEIRRNGIKVADNSGTFQNKVLTGDFALSGRNPKDGHAGMDASLAEYILISGAPSTDVRQRIEGYLAHKWGLEDDLPPGHPYKSFAPGGGVVVHDIMAAANSGGSISPAGLIEVQDGESQSFIITPDPGFLISDVHFDGVTVGALTNLDIPSVKATHSIEAFFEVIPTGTWTPAEISTQLWLDASDSSSIVSNGGSIMEWNDKSGNGRHATQSNALAQPLGGLNAQNGLNVLNFDGSNDSLNVDLDFLAGVSHSAFIVTKTTKYANLYGAANGSEGSKSLHVGFRNSSSYRMNYWGNDWYGSISSSFQMDDSNILNYVWKSGVSKEIFTNGISEGTRTSAGVIGTMAGGGKIGNVVGQGAYGGDIAEIIMITGEVSSEDRERIEGYLAHKWGLQANLSATHPYKNVAPGGSSIVTHDIVAVSNPGGTISPSGTLSVEEGTNQSFTITPDSGYAISDVRVDGVSIGVVDQYEFLNVGDAHDIEVFFQPVGTYISINAGGSNFTTQEGTSFSADQYFDRGSAHSTSHAISGTEDDILYQKTRYGNMTYSIPVTNGHYRVTLKFCETYFTGAGRRVFDVDLEGAKVIDNIDLFTIVGHDVAYDLSFVTTVYDGVLNIDFMSEVNNAIISGISIVPM